MILIESLKKPLNNSCATTKLGDANQWILKQCYEILRSQSKNIIKGIIMMIRYASEYLLLLNLFLLFVHLIALHFSASFQKPICKNLFILKDQQRLSQTKIFVSAKRHTRWWYTESFSIFSCQCTEMFIW